METLDFISSIEAQVRNRNRMQTQESRQALPSLEMTVSPTSAQESAAAIRLRQLMEQRKQLNDKVEKHAKRATEFVLSPPICRPKSQIRMINSHLRLRSAMSGERMPI